MTWRMPEQCDNCPFASSGKGLAMRRSLAPGRWREILDSLRQGAPFHCHKTTVDMIEDEETGDVVDVGPKAKLCAGSIEWGDKHGVSSNLQRVMERIDAMEKERHGTRLAR